MQNILRLVCFAKDDDWFVVVMFCYTSASCLSFNIKNNNGRTAIRKTSDINDNEYFTHDK